MSRQLPTCPVCELALAEKRYSGTNAIDRRIVRADAWLDHALFSRFPRAHHWVYEVAWWRMLDAYRWVERFMR